MAELGDRPVGRTWQEVLLACLAFLFHRSPRFAGSSTRPAFGITGAVLMLLPVAYSFASRIPFLQSRITPRVLMQALMRVVYTGILGPLFGIQVSSPFPICSAM